MKKDHRNKIINKKINKLMAGCCKVCGETDYAVLDNHRIIPGKNGGTYQRSNVICVCCACHRKIHDGQIKIDGWYFSTTGYLLHYFDENGVEHFS